jgi:hypothetical protein
MSARGESARYIARVMDGGRQDAGGNGGSAPSQRRADWPDPPRRDAYHGLAGRIVETIEPHSEADPAAVLTQFLVAFGSAIGRSAGFTAESTFHGTNLYAIAVGATSKGRKGSSWQQASRPIVLAAEGWVSRIVGGLSSGEGLIEAVRDPVEERRKAKTKSERADADADGYITELADEGESDKRLLVYEPEYASVLRVMRRDGSTLSAIIRQAWESGGLQTLTRKNPLRATGAHLSIIGHISAEELRRELLSTDAASGYANRYLYVCARRSKELPEGGNLTDRDWAPLIGDLRAAVRHGETTPIVARDAEARELWATVYGPLSEGKPGLYGAVTSRAEAQVMRLAVIYALLDRAPEVRVAHLSAALALWDYCAASCRYIWGDALGDPTADEVLDRLRAAHPDGLTRNEIRDQFGRHKSAEEISRALAHLAELGLAKGDQEQTGGRPAERWRALTAHTALSAQPVLLDFPTPSGCAISAESAESPDAEIVWTLVSRSGVRPSPSLEDALRNPAAAEELRASVDGEWVGDDASESAT